MSYIDEKPVVAINGTTTDSERSRSPSPEMELSSNDSNYLPRNTDGFTTSDPENSIFNANYLTSDDKQISQILKEANSINNIHQNNVQDTSRVKVSFREKITPSVDKSYNNEQ